MRAFDEVDRLLLVLFWLPDAVFVPEPLPLPLPVLVWRPVLVSPSLFGALVMLLSELSAVRVADPEGVGVGVAVCLEEVSTNMLVPHWNEACCYPQPNSRSLLSLFCRTTRESNSGSHLGHGHAAEKVAKTRKRREKSRLRCVLMLKLVVVDTPKFQLSFVPPSNLVDPKLNFYSIDSRNNYAIFVLVCLRFRGRFAVERRRRRCCLC